MVRKWKTRAERKKIYDEVLQKAERSKAKVRAAQTRPPTSKENPKVQTKKPGFKKMEPITEMPKKTAKDTKNNYAMALLRASEISDSARLQNAFGGKAERETLDLTASEAWNRTVVEASEPAEPSFSIEHRANLSLQDEIQRIEHETWAREFHIKHSQFGLFSEPEERLRIRGTLQLFSWYGDSSVVKTLGHRGTDVNAKNSNGDTALHFSSMAGNFETTLFLMEQGARINAKNKDGSTPLHEAALYGHEAIVELLIRNGAKVNAEMNDWKRPLNLANEKDHPETARVLKAHGATEKPSWFWNSKIILGVSVILAVIVWSFVIYRDIYRRFDADRDITITPKKDPDVILMPGSESASDIGTKMLERR